MMAIVAIGFLVLSLSALAAITPFYLVPRVIRRAEEWGILDLPDERKAHTTPTPRLGGLSIMPAYWIGSAVALLLASVFSLKILSHDLPAFLNAVLGLLIGCSGIFLLGCIDDFKRLTAGQKLATQLGIVAISLNFLPLPSAIFGFNVDPLLLSGLIFCWLVILPNSVNLLDGVDGLTSTIASIFFGSLCLIAMGIGEWGWLLILGPALASTLGFLRFNWAPARIFLGDSGSLLIGFAVAYLSIIFALTPKLSSGMSWNPVISLLLTSVWFLDTTSAVVRRYFEKRPSLKIFFRRSRGVYLALQSEALANICRPDRKHLHHRLMDMGFNAKQVVLILSSLAGGTMFAAVGLTISSFSIASLSAQQLIVGSLGFLILVLTSTAWLYRHGLLRSSAKSTAPESISNQKAA